MTFSPLLRFPTLELFASLTKLRGGVLPRAFCFAFPCACLALIMKIFEDRIFVRYFFGSMEIMNNNAAYTGFNFAMSFLLVFRTSQAYARFWEGVSNSYIMIGEWLDFAGTVVAFCRHSKADAATTRAFHHRLVRLMSLLHASALASLRGIDGSNFDLIDANGLEPEVLDHALVAEHPTAMIAQWIQELVVDGIEEHVVTTAPPIVSRSFHEFSVGMLGYHNAMKVQATKFPFNYTQLSAILLLFHWVVTPFVMVQWIVWPSWVFFLTLIQVLVFWALYFTAVEIESPFKKQVETNVAATTQAEFNRRLLLLIDDRTREIPQLSKQAELDVSILAAQCSITTEASMSFEEWQDPQPGQSYKMLRKAFKNVKVKFARQISPTTVQLAPTRDQGDSANDAPSESQNQNRSSLRESNVSHTFADLHKRIGNSLRISQTELQQMDNGNTGSHAQLEKRGTVQQQSDREGEDQHESKNKPICDLIQIQRSEASEPSIGHSNLSSLSPSHVIQIERSGISGNILEEGSNRSGEGCDVEELKTPQHAKLHGNATFSV